MEILQFGDLELFPGLNLFLDDIWITEFKLNIHLLVFEPAG